MPSKKLKDQLFKERGNLLSIDFKKDMIDLYSEYANLTKVYGDIPRIKMVIDKFESQFKDFVKNAR